MYKRLPNRLGILDVYLVNEEGYVFSKLTQKVLRPFGVYPQVSLKTVDGQQRKFYVHRLVAETFLGPCPQGCEVLHGELGKSVPSLSNIRYGTHSENLRDHVRFGGNWPNQYSEITGVSFDKSRGKWVAQLKRDGRNISGGRHDSEAEAEAAVKRLKHSLGEV